MRTCFSKEHYLIYLLRNWGQRARDSWENFHHSIELERRVFSRLLYFKNSNSSRRAQRSFYNDCDISCKNETMNLWDNVTTGQDISSFINQNSKMPTRISKCDLFFPVLELQNNISSSTEGIFLYLFSNTIFTFSKLESFLSITWLIFVAILFLFTFASDKFRNDIKINRYIKLEIVT